MTSLLIDPEKISVIGKDGVSRDFLLGKIPYFAGAREISTQFIPTGMPVTGNYTKNQVLGVKICKYIAAITEDGREVVLSTEALADNHIPDVKTGAALERAMLEKVGGFLEPSSIQKFLKDWLQNLPSLLSRILTALLLASSTKKSQPTKN